MTTMLVKSGSVVATMDELFERVFWRSPKLAHEAQQLWKHLKDSPDGMSSSKWKEWIERRNLTVGQYYNMIKGLRGAGLIEKRRGTYHISTGFLREMEQMVRLYSTITGYEPRI